MTICAGHQGTDAALEICAHVYYSQTCMTGAVKVGTSFHEQSVHFTLHTTWSFALRYWAVATDISLYTQHSNP